MKFRVAGLVLIIAGSYLAYTFVYEPIRDASRHEPFVRLSLKGTLFAPFALIGVLTLILGPRTEQVFGTRDHPTGQGIGLAVLVVVGGLLLYWWVKSRVEGYGYDTSGREVQLRELKQSPGGFPSRRLTPPDED